VNDDDLELEPETHKGRVVDWKPPARSAPTPVSLAALAGGLLVGAAGGGALAWSLKPEPEPLTPEVVLRDYSDEEMSVLCLPYTRQAVTTLEAAQGRVDDLTTRVSEQAAEVANLEALLTSATEARTDLETRLKVARRALTTLQSELDTAKEEKRELVLRLEETEAELETTKVALADEASRAIRAESRVVARTWEAFTQEAALSVCERGSKARLDKCREAVDGALRPLERRFRACLTSGQSVPMLHFTEDLDQVPATGAALDPADKFLRGWYVLFCDPDLPEADRDRDRRVDDREAPATPDFGEP
jgi:hypothetical protein